MRLHPFLVEMLDVIVNGDSDFQMYNDGWSPEDKRNALAHVKAIESLILCMSSTLFSAPFLPKIGQ